MRLRWALALWLVATTGLAQDEVRVRLENTPGRDKLVAVVTSVAPGPSHVGFGWVDVRLTNPGAMPHRVELELARVALYQADVGMHKTLTLGPRAEERVTLPLASSGYGFRLNIIVDGVDLAERDRPFAGSRNRAPVALLLITDDSRLAGDVRAAVRKAIVGSRYLRVAIRSVRPGRLPSHVDRMTGFPVVFVDARARGLTSERQECLSQALRAGAGVVLVGAGTLPPGSLARLLARADARSGVFGFGHWLATDSMAEFNSERFRSWYRSLPGLASKSAKPFTDARFVTYRIPGLGEVPMTAFLVLILGFALLVGPVNFYVVSRKLKRPLLLFLTVPVIGGVFTAMILGYGLASEGFGIRGVAESLTLLDQREHMAVTRCARTLYAGIEPDRLRPGPGTFVESPLVARDGRRHAQRYHVDLDDGRSIAGSALPSRTLTPMFTETIAPARVRLRFRRRDDGKLDLLAGADFAPLPSEGSIVFRDFSGQWFWNDGAERMRPVSEREGKLRFKELAAQLQVPRVLGGYRGAQPSAWVAARLEQRPLTPGSYLALVGETPLFDTLGLDVAWDRRRHVVRGTLAREDVFDR